MDPLEAYVRAVEAAYNARNALAVPPVAATTFAFGKLEREELQSYPAIGWDELDGDIAAAGTGTETTADDTIGDMHPRCAVVVWGANREHARRAAYLLIAASRDVSSALGVATFERYEIKGGDEHAQHGFQFVLEARVAIPVPAEPVPVTTEVTVEGHEHEVTVGGEVVC